MGVRSRHRSADIATVVSGVLRALYCCVPAVLTYVPPAHAQPAAPPTLDSEIPAQPLRRALAAFATQTGLQLVYVSGIVADQKSHAVQAGLGAQEALAHLLQGTGLQFKYLTPNSVRIFRAEPPRQSTTRAPREDKLNEVVVTASRREENLQDVPIAIQVLTGDVLVKLNATTFDDFVSYLPGVTAHGVGPGQSNIYVRGLATVEPGQQAVVVGGTFSNVAVYLDEQSAQFPSHNLDVYTADLERIEMLEGPQGTLFGAGAQAGVLRYITNKPKLNVTEGRVNAGYAWTSQGVPSHSLDAVINIPLVTDKLAVRAVIYDDKRGGYIDNTAATFARANTDVGIHYAYANGQVPANSVVINNFNIAGRDINPVTYEGARLETLYHFEENWNALLSLSYHRIEADGVFAEMATNALGQPQPDLSVQLYNPSYVKDRFENAALTIDGRIAALKLLYAGSYLVRNVEQVQDYTQYARGPYVDYYQCVNPTAPTQSPSPAAAQCFSASSTWHDQARNTHQSHELRLAAPDDWRLRGVGGLFYEDYRIQDQTDWFYVTALPYFSSIAPPTGYFVLNGKVVCTCQPEPSAVFVPGLPPTSNNPNGRPPGDGFFNDVTRSYTQRAAYLSLDFDLIPKTLTLTAGTRYFRIHDSLVGSSVGSFGCQLIWNPTAPNPCVNRDTANIDAEGLHPTYSGFTSRVNLSWKATNNSLLYYTWSQGFRPGSFNRPVATPPGSPLAAPSNPQPYQAQAYAHGGWQPPRIIAPDRLVNNELGWKTQWLDGRLRWDGALYQEDWSDVQVPVSAVGVTPPDIINGGHYRVRGVETFFLARVATGLTIEAGTDWNHSELIEEAPLAWADGTLIDFRTLRNSTGKKVPNPAGSLGSALAAAPVFQGHVRLRYEYPFYGYDAFAQIGATHQSQSLASTDQLSRDLQGNSTAYVLPHFTTYDASLGVWKDAWLVQVYGLNLTDTRAELYANYHQSYKAVTVSRPRTIGLRFSYRF
jgi:outer membrane receptor protein involved in Fe transport